VSSPAATSIMLWAQRIHSKRLAKPHELLDIKANATLEEAQAAFHKLARIAHPDLHRNELTPEELEMLTSAYAVVAGAYQAFRTAATATQPIKPIREPSPTPPKPTPAATPPSSGSGPVLNPAQAMSGKALLYYRKAEIALKRGDLKGAVLQLKLAIAADPASALLRTALSEVQSEIKTRGE
jgi:hypothetical protein